MTVSVVICAYTNDRWNDILAAVDSVCKQQTTAHETILVIDHNASLLQRATDHFADIDGLSVVANDGPRGLSGARNTGWRIATGEVVAFLDDDAVAEADWLSHLAIPYQEPSVVGVGGAILPAWRAQAPATFPDEFLWVVGCTYRGMPSGVARVRNMIGANMSLRRSALELVDGFDPDLGRVGTVPVGCEETELCLRVQDRIPGACIAYTPAARVWHSIPPERGSWSYFRARCFAEGVSKAHVSRLAGAGPALSTERSYVTRTLPRGFVRSLADATAGRQPSAVGRAARITTGLAWTTAGYVVGSVRGKAPTDATITESPSEREHEQRP